MTSGGQRVLLIFLLVSVVALVSVEACRTYYRPVCGTDDKTYWNECVFRRHNCRNGVTVAYLGRCKSRCPLFCTPIYRPVCGSNGQTFWNECELRRKSCGQPARRRVSVAYSGQCKAKTRECPKVCLQLYSPVCGSDGQTYWNKCELKRHVCRVEGQDGRTRSVSVAYPGRCIVDNTVTKPPRDCEALCLAVYTPVCGTDGKTYSNRCFLGLANCNQGTSVDVARDGRCEDVATTTEKPNCNTICPEIYDPVCGSDGKTYSSGCRLSAASCTQGIGITVVGRGTCEDANCNTICPTIYDPVCGSDGKTYSSGCRLRAASCTQGIGITIVGRGTCEDGGTPGGLGSSTPADAAIETLVDEVRVQVEGNTGRRFNQFQAVSYRSQVVAGTNYFVKIRVGVNEFIHVKIFTPLPGSGAPSEVNGVRLNKSESDPIDFF